MPTLTVVAGANGAGKSTLTRLGRETFQRDAVLDPDAIAKSMIETGKTTASAMDAGREVLRLAGQLLQKRESFLVETTLSGNTYLRMIRQALAAGYRIRLLYVGTSNIEINLQRVRDRVKRGGHNVIVEDQQRRYPRSLENLRKVLPLAHEAILFDNSSADGHRKVAVKDDSRMTCYEPIPEWAANVL